MYTNKQTQWPISCYNYQSKFLLIWINVYNAPSSWQHNYLNHHYKYIFYNYAILKGFTAYSSQYVQAIYTTISVIMPTCISSSLIISG